MKVNKQQDVRDCGLCVIKSFLDHFYEQNVDISSLKTNVHFGKTGINADQFIKLANMYGIEATAFDVKAEDLIEAKMKDYFVAIIKSQTETHYVICKMHKKYFTIYDSSVGEYNVEFEKFKTIFTGLILTMKKTKLKPMLSKVKSYLFLALENCAPLCIFLLISNVAIIVINFAISTYLKVVIDKVIPNHLEKLLLLITIIFGGLVLAKIATRVVSRFAKFKLVTINEFLLQEVYFEKLSRSSVANLNKFTFEDHLRRVTALQSVALWLSSFLFEIFSDLICILTSSAFLFYIEIKLAIIVFAFGIVACFASISVASFLKPNQEKNLVYSLNVLQTNVDIIKTKNMLKNSDYFSLQNHRLIDGVQKAKHNEWIIFKKMTLHSTILLLVELSLPLVIIYLGTNKVLNNNMSLGTLLVFASITNYFIGPSLGIGDFYISMKQNRLALKLLEQVLSLPNEELNINGHKTDKIKTITIKNLSFSYDRPILAIKNLEITKNLIIDGENGRGKTTLLNLLSLHLFGTGKIEFNKLGYEYYNLQVLRDKICLVSSAGELPNMKILDFITCQRIERVNKLNILVASNVHLQTVLQNMNLTLLGTIENGGTNFSAGQKQLIWLLFAICGDYDVFLMDEAFENISSENFFLLKKVFATLKDKIFVEVSHSKRYIFPDAEVVDVDLFAQ